MAAHPAKVLELVVFRLNDGVAHERFLGTVDAVSAWISRQPGFVSRDLSYDAESDRWIEVVWWKTLEEARAAAHLAVTSAACRPMFALIDMGSALMAHADRLVTAPDALGETRRDLGDATDDGTARDRG